MNLTAARGLAVLLPCLLLGQTAILQVRVVDGEGAVHAPGSRDSRGLTVEVTDETGRPVQGAAVSYRLPEDGPGGTFANGLQTELILTGADGRATVRGFRLNRNPGPFQIRITVAKEQARAGLISNHFIAGDSEPGAAKTGAGGPRTSAPRVAKKRSNVKWIVLALVAAGAAGGAAAGVSRSGSAAAPPVPSAPAPVSIGSPTIVIGRP